MPQMDNLSSGRLWGQYDRPWSARPTHWWAERAFE
jgi:hypothetical protein